MSSEGRTLTRWTLLRSKRDVEQFSPCCSRSIDRVHLRFVHESRYSYTEALAKFTSRVPCGCRSLSGSGGWRCGVRLHVLAGSNAHRLGRRCDRPRNVDLVCGGRTAEPGGGRLSCDEGGPCGVRLARAHRPHRRGSLFLAAVGLALLRAGSASTGDTKAYLITLGLVSVALSWGLVHTVFTLRYARTFYSQPVGGIDFNEDDPPNYLDFAYLALTIGMTFQVSDTNLTTKAIRRIALSHALLSYLFGAVIVALVINVVSSLLH